MAKFYTLGPLRIEEIRAVVMGLRAIADGPPCAERSPARSALRNLDPRIVIHEEVQGEHQPHV